MNRKTKAIDALIRRYQNGACTPFEQELLESVLFTDEAHGPEMTVSELYKDELWKRLRPLLEEKKAKRYKWYYAAAVLLVGVGFYFALVTGKHGLGNGSTRLSDIVPGGNKATLTLADGGTVNLDSTRKGIIVSNGNITYDDGGNVPGTGPREEEEEAKQLTLSTPRGGQYQLILGDGTKIWLNAATTIKYPAKFTGDNREVELDGEGYFEVTNNDKPFIIKSNGQRTTVLGTKFNISSYSDDQAVKTTLAEGSVRVAVPNASNPLLLKPGEQSSYRQNAPLTKRMVDVQHELAWKNGYFDFEGKGFGQVMKELARWYDLEVHYEGPVPDISFFGDVERNNKLSIVLSLLESNYINYRLEAGRKLIIKTN